MNKQRETIYSIRRSALEGKEQKEYALGIAEDLAMNVSSRTAPAKSIRKSGTSRNSPAKSSTSSALT